jgi:dipeptidyl-peptidase III
VLRSARTRFPEHDTDLGASYTNARRIASPTTALPAHSRIPEQDDQITFAPALPPRSEPSTSGPPSPRPPPFSSLYFPTTADLDRYKFAVTEGASEDNPATAPAPSFEEAFAEDEADRTAKYREADAKGESSGKGADDGEPPPPYSEGSSPLDSFTYVMASAGGPASIITQVQQSPGAPINSLGGESVVFCSWD